MDSHDDLLRAVQLYIKLGKRVGLTIRQLGYPTDNALKGWYREYEQRLNCARAWYARRSTHRPRRSGWLIPSSQSNSISTRSVDDLVQAIGAASAA